MNLKKSTKKALNILQLAYENGLISYPRVDNDFITQKKGFDLFPHPKMPPVIKILEPIRETEFELNKKTALLYMSTFGFLNPSEIYGTAGLIDEYFNDDLSFVDEKKESIANQIVKTFDEFLVENNITLKTLLRASDMYYAAMDDADTSSFLLFENEEVFFHKQEPAFRGDLRPSPLKSFIRWEVSQERVKKKEEPKKQAEESVSEKKNNLLYVKKFKTLRAGLEYYRFFYLESVRMVQLSLQTAVNSKRHMKELIDEISSFNEKTK